MSVAHEAIPDDDGEPVVDQLHTADMPLMPDMQIEAQIQATPAVNEIPPSERKTQRRTVPIEGNFDETDLFTIYANEMGGVGLLDRDDEARLNKAVLSGLSARAKLEAGGISRKERSQVARDVQEGQEATHDFTTANLRLVVSIAKRYQGKGLPLLDLVQEGNLGLMRAVDKFRADKGFKFSTYATWWIRQNIERSLPTTGRTIRLSVVAAEHLRQLQMARAEFTEDNRRHPTLVELTQLTGFPEEKVVALQIQEMDVAEFSDPVTNRGDSGMTVEDTVYDPTSADGYQDAEYRLVRGAART
ncbi:MAG: sigma-70 family RNA polymerase sigma factor [Candidatus Saccharibacteria bacterium]